ncbi:hypothetical protein [Salinibacter grassmerensis]|uniref:hypothetical protein n=1 Tax=Salinibacter grassmerensis TaxID=3040353 RepID=UPI0021E7ED2D|nr:hypothetical protein [Salinibacter grassmerensis]
MSQVLRLVRSWIVKPSPALLRWSVIGGLVGSLCLVWGARPGAAQRATQGASDVYSVTYRPPDVEYTTYPGDHFDLIVQDGVEDTAWRIREALERTREGTTDLMGVRSSIHMPVVVDGFSDRSNGFVTPFPFKQEIEAPSLRADALVARASSWPSIVGSHELVHATQAEINSGFGLGSVVRFFAPDVARAGNLTAPRGLLEGAAVYRESRIEEGAGRLNAPLFTMKMRAAMLSDDPWSLTQMLAPPAYTQPFNRFYIGGAHAFKAWAEQGDTTSTKFFQRATALHNQFPFLGFGVGLWNGLGESPKRISEDLRATLRADYQQDLSRRRPFTDARRIAGQPGHNYRRPYWLTEDTLVTYLHGYDVRRGFYRVNAETGDRSLIRVQSITEDYTYSLGRDTSALYASRYVPDPLVPTQNIAEAERVGLKDGAATQVTEGGRVFAPVEAPNDSLWAVRNDGSFSQWAAVQNRTAKSLTDFERARFKKIAPSPAENTIAVLLNVDGTQRLYRVDHHRRDRVRLRPWIGLQDAVIYDVSWGPDGRYLLFAADLDETPDVFAFDTKDHEVRRLTNVRFGALEPTLSPDRETVAFVEYQHERHELARIPFRPQAAPLVDSTRVVRGGESPQPPPRVQSTETADLGAGRAYEAWRHLAPRMVYPTLSYDPDETDRPGAARFERLGVGVGLGVAGSDPLGRWRYQGNGFWQDGRLWGSATVQTGRWLLRPSLTAYNTPDTLPVRLETGRGLRAARIGFEERGIALGTQIPIRLQSNVYRSALSLSLGAEYRQTRYFGSALNVLAEDQAARLGQWRDRITLSPRGAWGHRVQQNPRDLVPNQGVVVQSRAEIDAWTEGVAASRALISEVDVYLPLFLRSHTGVRLGAGVLSQNAGAVLGTDQFIPRGYEDRSLGAGSFVRVGAEVTQPIWYIDDGSTLVPFYAKALYGYGFGQALTRVDSSGPTYSSFGAGIGFQFRFFYALEFDLQVGAAVRLEPGDVEPVWR